MQDTHGSSQEEWVGFDLDGTLAEYDGWKGIEHIGKPVESMVLIAKLLHLLGKKIKILTARVAPRDDGDGGDKAKKFIEKWCKKHLGFVPDITYNKDASMAALFDDRAVAVEQNTGKVLGGWPDFLPRASGKATAAILGITQKRASLSIRERLIRVCMRRNPGMSRDSAIKYIDNGGVERELSARRVSKGWKSWAM